ncbi:MAG: PP2C family serine/threonine-protein phosphatase [Planctomycetota bacterium]
MWRFIAGSVAGPSHERTGAPCQDSQRVQVLTRLGASSIVACVADGAGSGEMSQDGSSLACETIQELATAAYDASEGSFASVTEDDVLGWCREARERIEKLAELRGGKVRDYATTLCVACLSPGHAVFFQIGDGAIVVRRNGTLGVVFWPQSGEYANSTMFLTGDGFETHLEFQNATGDFSDIALMTDGVERLALSFEGQTPHPPFFEPLFGALHAAEDPAALNPELLRFLDSESMKLRSDDDKTVVLAAQAAS